MCVSCICMCLRARKRACKQVYVCVCVCMCACACACACARACARACTYVYVCICACTCACVRVYNLPATLQHLKPKSPARHILSLPPPPNLSPPPPLPLCHAPPLPVHWGGRRRVSPNLPPSSLADSMLTWQTSSNNAHVPEICFLRSKFFFFDYVC